VPLQDWNLKSTFDGAYSLHGEDHRPPTRDWVKLHYHREVVLPFIKAQVTGLIDGLGLQTNQTVVIVGGAFGWSAEEFMSRGWPLGTVAVTDTSTYVHDNKGGTEETEIDAAITLATLDPTSGEGLIVKNRNFDGGGRVRIGINILDEDLTNNGGRNRVRNAVGGTIDWLITEEVISTLSDAELVDFLGDVDSIRNTNNIVHLTSPLADNPDSQDPNYNWKSMADWRTFLNANGFSSHVLVEQGTFGVF